MGSMLKARFPRRDVMGGQADQYRTRQGRRGQDASTSVDRLG